MISHVEHILHIDSEPQLVHDKLTKLEGLRSWWTEKTAGDPTEGGLLEFRFMEGAFVDMKVEMAASLEVKWRCVNAQPHWIGSRVHIILVWDEEVLKTRVHFKHDEWKETTDHIAYVNFIWAGYLTSLRDLCEKGKGSPYKGRN